MPCISMIATILTISSYSLLTIMFLFISFTIRHLNSIDIHRRLPPRLKYNISRDQNVNWTLCDDIIHGLGTDSKESDTISDAALLQPGHLHLVPLEIISSVGGIFLDNYFYFLRIRNILV